MSFPIRRAGLLPLFAAAIALGIACSTSSTHAVNGARAGNAGRPAAPQVPQQTQPRADAQPQQARQLTATASMQGEPPEAGSRVSFQGDSRFLLGANVPWINWGCDFGCGADGGGVSDPSVTTQLEPVFKQARAAGVRTLRWWMFEDDPQQIQRDGSGTPTGLSPGVYTDIDAALALAQKYDLNYDFVLFSAPTALPKGWVANPSQRAALGRVLTPLFAHYSGNSHILAWEVINEPEFDIWNGKIDQAPVQAMVKTIVDAVHANSKTYVTIGAAMLDGLDMWTGMGFDFYTAHWYDYMNGGNYDALLWSYDDVRARYHLDAPVVIGELYLAPDSQPMDRLHHFYDTGYAGAWPWSLFPDHTDDGMTVDLTATNAFNQEHGDISPPIDLGVTIAAYTAYHDPAFTIAGSTSPGSSASGSSVKASVTATSDSDTTVLVDLEVYSPAGAQIAQQVFSSEDFKAGQSKQYALSWKPGSEKGAYTFKTGVFTTDWKKLFTWNDSVATVQVK